MTKKQIILIISGGILLTAAGIGAYHLWFKDKTHSNSDLDKLQKDLGNTGGEVAKPSQDEYSSNIKQAGSYKGGSAIAVGDEGRKVALMQALLNHYENAGLKIDGLFGNATRLALLKSGFVRCTVAATCEISMADLNKYLTKTKTDSTFNKNYSVTTNKQMKAVYDKYSS